MKIQDKLRFLGDDETDGVGLIWIYRECFQSFSGLMDVHFGSRRVVQPCEG